MKRELTVVACTTHFFGDAFVRPFEVEAPTGGIIHCNFTDDLSLARDADALWFHMPAELHLPKRRKPGQTWILMSMESAANYPRLECPDFLGQFDIVMTYRLDADIPVIYPNRRIFGDFRGPPGGKPDLAGKTDLAAYIASNSVAYRDAYVRELMRYMPIDCLGACLNNKTIEGFVTGPTAARKGGFRAILKVLPRYKFYLAFENSLATDYVTEKLFHALSVGTVPVYCGAGNVREFLPAENAAINVADFEGPEDLAAYLTHLDQDDEAYGAHLAWRHRELSPEFERLLDLGDQSGKHRMALKLAHGLGVECPFGGRLRNPA